MCERCDYPIFVNECYLIVLRKQDGTKIMAVPDFDTAVKKFSVICEEGDVEIRGFNGSGTAYKCDVEKIWKRAYELEKMKVK